MGTPANIREILVGFGKNKQADIATKNTAAGLWRMNKLNASFMPPKLNTEDDAAEYGKGHEFAENVYKTSWDVSGQLEKYLSSEFGAWGMAFSLGHVVKTGAEPNFIYTITPADPVTDGIELPYFTVLEQIRPGASAVIDRANIGCAVEGWTWTVGSGPGRANSKFVVDVVGSGKHDDAPALVMPVATAEHLLPSSSLAATIIGVDYVAAKDIISLEATWKNNMRLDAGFFPGSGFQTALTPSSGAVRGRLEFGDRAATLKFVARFKNGSTELAKALALTEGTAVISQSFDANNSLEATYHRVIFSVADLGETDGLVSVEVTATPLWHNVNKLLTVVAKCNTDEICEAEA